jgi:GNAT superfamily N-acetyltransferase
MNLTPRCNCPAGRWAFSYTAEPVGLWRRVSALVEAIKAGRLLLEVALKFFRPSGAWRVVLSTAERNEAAQRLFASTGFRRTMIEMTLELDGPPF